MGLCNYRPFPAFSLDICNRSLALNLKPTQATCSYAQACRCQQQESAFFNASPSKHLRSRLTRTPPRLSCSIHARIHKPFSYPSQHHSNRNRRHPHQPDTTFRTRSKSSRTAPQTRPHVRLRPGSAGELSVPARPAGRVDRAEQRAGEATLRGRAGAGHGGRLLPAGEPVPDAEPPRAVRADQPVHRAQRARHRPEARLDAPMALVHGEAARLLPRHGRHGEGRHHARPARRRRALPGNRRRGPAGPARRRRQAARRGERHGPW